jgi:predicted nucleic acid-binding protein
VKVVVDTNIAFSCAVRSDSAIGEVLLHDPGQLRFYAPSYLLEEFTRHRAKLKRASKLTDEQLDAAWTAITDKIEFIDDPAVSFANREKARAVAADVDEFDAPFIALALELDALLWTGDYTLIRGVRNKGFHHVITTVELAHMR